MRASVSIDGSYRVCSRVAARQAAVGLMLALWLALLALAIAPQLHHAHHEEAGHEHHHCPVTLLTGGQFALGSPAMPVVSAPRVEFFASPLHFLLFPQVSDVRLLPGRAPPIVLFPA